MGNYFWLFLFFCDLTATSRTWTSRVTSPADASPDYFDYEEHNVDTDGRLAVAGPKVSNAKVKVTHGDFPHQVSLQDTDRQNPHFCGASIIHPKFLLTAAHCFVDPYKLSQFRAVAGEHDLTRSEGNREQIRKVTRLIKHEDYDATTYENDIALLELNERLDFDNEYVRPIALWDSAWQHPDIPVDIYLGMEGGEGIKAYSESEKTHRTIIRNAQDPEGLTFNWFNGKFYFTEANRIFSADENGTNVRAVFESKQYGTIQGLAVDAVTGNLYGVSRSGFVFVCKAQRNEQLSCTHLLREQGNLLGIALDPNSGQMYWTSWPDDKIMRAQMDGTEVVEFLSGLDHPVGITIDFAESRLFWTEYGAHNVCSSALDGSDIFVVADNETETVDGGSAVRYPWGIALHDDYVYWGNYHGNGLHRCLKNGGEIETVLTDQGHIQQLTSNERNFHITRPNDCESKNCGHICVLTRSSCSCVH